MQKAATFLITKFTFIVIRTSNANATIANITGDFSARIINYLNNGINDINDSTEYFYLLNYLMAKTLNEIIAINDASNANGAKDNITGKICCNNSCFLPFFNTLEK
ncbi:hypothetical protein GJ496_003907 [Pomphorhynchus laevis]|nr:hypothetical protein GJ496_003907 [Pomphorhynchus laevis]